MTRARLATALQDRRAFWSLVVLVVAYVGLVAAYQRTIPIFEAPDEQSHLAYVAWIRLEGRLPRYGERPDVPGEGMQPPLYYLMVAPLHAALGAGDASLLEELTRASRWIYGQESERSVPRDALLRPATPGGSVRRFQPDERLSNLRSLRWGTLPFGLLTLLFTFAAIRRASGSPALALLGGALIGLSPQFVFVSSYVSNDAAGASIGAAAFWLFSAAMQGPHPARRHYLTLALLFALGAMVKNATLPVVAVTGAALFGFDSRPLRTRAADAALAGALALVLVAPHAASNLERFGDPTGLDALWASATGLPRPEDYGGLASYLLKMYWLTTSMSYWCVFGWMDLFAPVGVYFAYFLLMGAGVLGFALGGKARERSGDAPSRALPLYVVAAPLATFAIHVWLNTKCIQPQGRHLFAAAPHVACLLSMGLAQLTTGRVWRIAWPLVWGISAVLLGLAVYCLLGVIAPAYQ